MPQYQNWETVDPGTLFDAPTRKDEANPKVMRERNRMREIKRERKERREEGKKKLIF